MRLEPTVDRSHFTEAELSVLRLDGDCVPLGLAAVLPDVPVDAAVRAASLAPAVARYGLVVESWGAAWVHGAWPLLPPVLPLAVDVRAGRRTRMLRPAPREARFVVGDVVLLGGVRVTSPFKTAFDFARRSDDFGGDVVDVTRALLDAAGMDGATAATAAVDGPLCSHRARAIVRLASLR